MQTPTSPHRTVQLWSGLLGAAAFLLAFLVLTVLIPGPLRPLDLALNAYPGQNFAAIRPYLEVLDRIGQRAVCLPILAAVAGWASYRARSRRPLVVAGASVFAVNAFVAVFKFGLERGAPLANEPDFLTGGVMYPSGHAANVLLVYGLAAYLWWRYTDASRRTRWTLVVVVAVLTATMFATSLSLRWHWFTDLIGGVLVGAAALRATVVTDRAIPFTPLTGSGEPVTRPVDEHLRARRKSAQRADLVAASPVRRTASSRERW